jgi:hypothetical protein
MEHIEMTGTFVVSQFDDEPAFEEIDLQTNPGQNDPEDLQEWQRKGGRISHFEALQLIEKEIAMDPTAEAKYLPQFSRIKNRIVQQYAPSQQQVPNQQ